LASGAICDASSFLQGSVKGRTQNLRGGRRHRYRNSLYGVLALPVRYRQIFSIKALRRLSVLIVLGCPVSYRSVALQNRSSPFTDCSGLALPA
jgi:hypothetical protein